MLKAQFTNTIYRFSTVPQGVEYYKLSRVSLMKLAEEAEAIQRFGKSVRLDIPKIDTYLEHRQNSK